MSTAETAPSATTRTAIVTGAMQWFYTYGWFTGSILGGAMYYLLSRRRVHRAAAIESIAR